MTTAAAHAEARGHTVAASVVGLLAALLGVAALVWMWLAPSLPIAAGAIGMHAAAALLARTAARLGGAAPCEQDLVLILALVAPAFGPGLAWTLRLLRAPDSERNAHAAFEAEFAATSDAGSPELERELQVRSHAQVLRHGSLEEKRNLLRQLTRIGERRYLLLLRHFLRDPEPELRLCAYAELARECQQREEQIGKLRTRADVVATADHQELAVARAALAEANRAYGTSGLLDVDMGHYWLEQACQLAESALAVDGQCRAAQCALALARAELGQIDLAWRLVADWPEDVEPAHDLARAELAFRRRDRGVCMAVAARLTARGEALPAWLEATMGSAAGERADLFAGRPSSPVLGRAAVGVDLGGSVAT